LDFSKGYGGTVVVSFNPWIFTYKAEGNGKDAKNEWRRENICYVFTRCSKLVHLFGCVTSGAQVAGRQKKDLRHATGS
jgi:hypothetical protein